MIKLLNGYAITTDAYQYVLGKPVTYTNKKGELENRTDNATYHPTLSSALLSHYKRMVRESIGDEVQTLQQAIDTAKQIEERIKALAQEPGFKE